MNRIIPAFWLAACAIALGAAQAMPVSMHPTGKNASAIASNQASQHPDADEDEAAPPIHIHHAHAATRKTTHKPAQKKITPPQAAKLYSLLLSD